MGDSGERLSYDEVKAVAHEIFRIESRNRTMRTAVMVFAFGLLAAIVFIVCIWFFLTNAESASVSNYDGNQANLVSKKTNDGAVLSTAISMMDVDGADLIDYKRDGKDANGEPDGEWIIQNPQLSNVRTISWKEGQDMHIHHISEVSRQDGKSAHVVATTKAKHLIKIYDSDYKDGDTYNFNVFFREWDLDASGGPQFKSWVEVAAESDEDNKNGKGRVLVGMKRDKVKSTDKAVNLEDYWCDNGDICKT